MSAILDLLRSGQAEPGSSREAPTQGESSTLAAEPTFDDVLPGRHNDRIVLTYTPLDEKAALAHVRDNGAGATCLFVGTTRDDFQGKSVRSLKYTSYSALARKMMRGVVETARGCGGGTSSRAPFGNAEKSTAAEQQVPAIRRDIKRIFLAHRLGDVDVAEPSILVCVSSAHRQAAFEACSEILEDVKRRVPIWKKEIYGGDYTGTEEWKANAA